MQFSRANSLIRIDEKLLKKVVVVISHFASKLCTKITSLFLFPRHGKCLWQQSCLLCRTFRRTIVSRSEVHKSNPRVPNDFFVESNDYIAVETWDSPLFKSSTAIFWNYKIDWGFPYCETCIVNHFETSFEYLRVSICWHGK